MVHSESGLANILQLHMRLGVSMTDDYVFYSIDFVFQTRTFTVDICSLFSSVNMKRRRVLRYLNQLFLTLLSQPSIQKLVNNLAQDCLGHLTEEAVHTDAYMLDIPRVEDALHSLELEFSSNLINQSLLRQAMLKAQIRVARRNAVYNETVWLFHRPLYSSSYGRFRSHRSCKLP